MYNLNSKEILSDRKIVKQLDGYVITMDTVLTLNNNDFKSVLERVHSMTRYEYSLINIKTKELLFTCDTISNIEYRYRLIKGRDSI